ncbi:FtsK/SpoIIIE domain-containing protein [Lysinibacillus fusiformis]|uniref:FtsK/SpoIIIE domain-containing protein n=1 Tax=Lysinibacillus fusiformis TaxID=28031 RepID=UPI00263BCB47|nr:FtsK/SpoIIIE domain-containing protein [Lysinibacillus fusiformis]MDC6267378.1 FtsK/SpoIIIE domain-containing protein [Lysinibacillus sphaericus]MDN4968188.1 FtsK/SpoIIIE domain-containing protein [Lysinibacillus fusiformis]MDN4968362.1 FtsK/SpoIIIE domain-containing protein [Lysinibacillus fusiformis]
MSLKRLINPSITSNEKYSNYDISSLKIDTVREILSSSFIDGVFGVEAYRVSNRDSFTFFSPPNYKVNWDKVKDVKLQYKLTKNENMTCFELFTAKISLFPVEMNTEESFWKIICSVCPPHINLMYQILLVFRQDNWKMRLHEQYDNYLNGVQNPSNYSFLRKIQRGINEKLDNLLRWENKHSEIEEIERKLEENGYRFNIRLVMSGGNQKEHAKLIQIIEKKINKYSYTNQWSISTDSSLEMIDNILKRRLDYNSKHSVLSTSELLPLVVINEKVEKLKPVSSDQSLIKTSKDVDIVKLLPLGNNLSEVNGKQIAEKFISSLKEVKKFNQEVKLKQSRTGSTLIKLTFELPDELRFSELNKVNVVNDIQMKMGVKQLQLIQGDGIREIDILLPLEKRQKVLLRNYIDTDQFKQYSKKNPLAFLVGVNEVGEPLYSCISKIKHLLVAGTTGSGKSVWLNQLILTLLTTKNPSDVQFFMIDIKQVELSVFEDFPHVQSIVTDTIEAIKLLNQLCVEMNRRYELFKKNDVKNISLYNKQSNIKLPYIICVIDEYAELSSKDNRVHEHVTSISQLARAAGIHLIIATQRPSADVIPSLIKSNLPSKIGFHCSNTRTYLTFLNTKPPYELLGNGDGTMCFEGQMEEHIRFQGCLIVDDLDDEGLEGKLIRRIARTFTMKKVNIDLPEVEEVVEESELDRLKKIIASSGETRVSPLRNLMKININKLNDLMKELVEEGWLEAPKTKQSGYKLIVSEEEKVKWIN